MDNLTHSLTGLVLARTGFHRISPHAALVMGIAANVPDLDMISLLGGPLLNLEVHRGYAHSFLLLPLIAILPVLLTMLIKRVRTGWLSLWLMSCIGVLSHLLLDWSNSYGIRFLLPFSPKWYALDCTYLYDGVILVVLLAAYSWPFLSRLVSHEIGDKSSTGQGIAIAAIVFFIAYDGARLLLHDRAMSTLNSRIYDQQNALQTAALPDAFNPLVWEGVAETSSAFHLLHINLMEEFNPETGRTLYKPSSRRSYEAAKHDKLFAEFLRFARFPLWSETIMKDGQTRVKLIDLRFGPPDKNHLNIAANVGRNGDVEQARFNFDEGSGSANTAR